MIIIGTHKVPINTPSTRIEDYLIGIFPQLPTKSSIKKAIKRNLILIDNNTANSGTIVSSGTIISFADNEKHKPKPLDYKLDIVYQDEHIAVINKPAGIEVSGNKYFTIQNAIITNIDVSSEKDALRLPRPVHRLDRSTSGLLLIAKTSKAIIDLGKQLEEKTINKRYRAIVSGKIPAEGIIDSKIDCKEAVTKYKLVKSYNSVISGYISLIDAFPVTGRTHQLRIHLSNLGHPIVGEKVYVSGPVLKGKGLFLSAVEIDFRHPALNERVTLSVEQPKKFEAFINKEINHWKTKNSLLSE